MTTLDLDFVRAQFPGLATSWTLFDNAGGSVPARQVVQRVSDYMSGCQVQLGATYGISADAAGRVAEGRRAVADLVNADPGEIVLGPSSTALVGLLARALRPAWRAGDEVVVTNLDHETNVGPWRALEAQGIVVREWRLRPEDCALHPEDLEPLLTPRTRLVAFTHCSNIAGGFHDVAEVTRRVRAAGALSCVDGVAFAPHRRVDVRALGADFYFLSLYKVYGPHVSALYGRGELLAGLENQNHFFLGQAEAATRLEPGGVTHELVAGLPGVLDYLLALDAHHFGAEGHFPADGADLAARLARTFELIGEHEERLAAPLLGFLAEHPAARVIGNPRADHAQRAPTISFVVEGTDSAAIPPLLDARELAVRYGHFYAYRPIRDLGLLDRNGVVRVSMVHYNSPQEVERLVDALAEVL